GAAHDGAARRRRGGGDAGPAGEVEHAGAGADSGGIEQGRDEAGAGRREGGAILRRRALPAAMLEIADRRRVEGHAAGMDTPSRAAAAGPASAPSGRPAQRRGAAPRKRDWTAAAFSAQA